MDFRHPFQPGRRRGAALAVLLGALHSPAGFPASPAMDELLASEDATAQAEWGQRYEHGEGVVRDPDAAVRLYCHAAGAGDADAAYRLGWMYANARGLPRNDALAAAWFTRAAESGDAHARRMLSRMEPAAERAACLLADGREYRRPLVSEEAPSAKTIARWVHRLAPDYRLDPALVLAVIRAESNFDPRALSPKNARGLMQLIPATARRFGVEDVWDPVDNLRGGMSYLRWLLDTFDGDEALALAGYNAGEGAVRRHRGIPPYPETRAYVKKISRWRRRAASAPGGAA